MEIQAAVVVPFFQYNPPITTALAAYNAPEIVK